MAIVYQHIRIDTRQVFYVGNNNSGAMKRWHFDNCRKV